MMANQTFGEISYPHKEVSIEWKIDNYFSICQKADTFIDSPTFHGLNASWHLRLYPNGERKFKSVGFLDLFLHSTNSGFEIKNIPLNVVMGVRSGNGKPCARFEISKVFIGNAGCRASKLFRRNDLMINKDNSALHGVVTLFAVVKQSTCFTDSSSQTASVNDSLYRDFFNLFHNKQKSDVVIKLKRRHFHAHKLILGARSPVFAAMFNHDMTENTSGEVNIKEDYDPDAFYEFLLFMYTGQIKEVSRQNVFQLFTLTDKYDVSVLKERCLKFMKRNLTLDNACDVLAIADRQNDAELKRLAKKLVVSNMQALFTTEKWITFIQENATLVEELLHDFYSC